MRLIALDHVVISVRSLDESVPFYRDILGMDDLLFGGGRHALHFGAQKINLHEVGEAIAPKATTVTPGAADLCFLVENLDAAIHRLQEHAVEILEGPVYRQGANSAVLSVYVRDPDGNLIELAQPENVVLASSDSS
ncbi:VOC family protein [Polycladidibacter stylochi]|uniref:VOC family protein n=1 Tax=Polycladidibacter stylochi TaxID=1807766 RepID=UPI00083668CD|nr:VOC family protein [Pseudovibrio stylochi]